MRFPRSAGILLHPTSLPGRFGIGELGEAARSFVDFLAESGQSLWQILPLGPTGYGDSPYACFSALAGNPLLIDLARLAAEGDIEAADLDRAPAFPEDRVDFGPVIAFKTGLLRRAAARFRRDAAGPRREAFGLFCAANADWLEDYALFIALKDAHGGAVWNTWERGIVTRQPEALAQWRERLDDALFAQRYLQFQFFRQWGDLNAYANARGIRVIGDVPIFVAYDSVDVWAHPELFHLDKSGRPTKVAGVPPDYFSKTGQLWGNPLYRWDVMAATGYAWWVARVRHTLRTVDVARIDHFRGFAACWEIPAGKTTAVNGQWVEGPGAALFDALRAELGDLPIIAEDLGVITRDVRRLRDHFKFPGMNILQFAFTTDAANAYLPHNLRRNSVIYTGTHDNDTTLGWYRTRDPKERNSLHCYLGPTNEEIHWALVRVAYASVADMVVVPLQDVLGLGSEARMNTPGKFGGNWGWRFRASDLLPHHRSHLTYLVLVYGRKKLPKKEPEEKAQ